MMSLGVSRVGIKTEQETERWKTCKRHLVDWEVHLSLP